MKRHAGFVSLSREHHEALLLATRLVQGKRALLRLWSHDPAWQAETVNRFFRDQLAAHFRIEEELIFPRAIGAGQEASVLVHRLLEDHRSLETMATECESLRGEPLQTLLRDFGSLLEKHVRSEERQFFPLCERALSADILESIARDVERFRSKGASV